MLSHLATELNGPLLDIKSRILDGQPAIEHWFLSQWREHSVPFYCSVDLRNSGHKLAPVDTNLFPGGFNNLSPCFLPLCVNAVQNAILRNCPDAQGVLLIPENHTRNRYYLQNVAQLSLILGQAGLTVRVGSLLIENVRSTTLQLPNGTNLTLEPLKRMGNRLTVDGFDPGVVLLNNDLSAGIPEILQGLEQVVLPPLAAGWTTRRKSRHFAAYRRIAHRFADLLGIDPWLITAYFASCGGINFRDHTGEECIAERVDEILQMIRAKYAEYEIKDKPFVMVKADNGTYGMGIMKVQDASEMRNLSRRQRTKMAVVKDGLEVRQVLIQEGVHTVDRINESVAEPVVYMVDRSVVGAFYRVHPERGTDENLNVPGMHFVPLGIEASCTLPDPERASDDAPNRFYAYGVVARLASLAAAIELEEMQQ
jgi:glutamate--cysteine ligase